MVRARPLDRRPARAWIDGRWRDARDGPRGYGLAASVWIATCRWRTAPRERPGGTVWVNCFEEGDLTVPFGGRKASGFGADKSLHAMEKFTALKTTWIQL